MVGAYGRGPREEVRMPRYVALLRAISNIPMVGLRNAVEKLGGTDVTSFGMSGNIFFDGAGTGSSWEVAIERVLKTPAMVRSKQRLKRAVEGNPFRGSAGAA